MKLHFFPAAAILMATGAAAAHAQTFTPLITQTIGSGANESFFTLDFQDGTVDHNYAFGYFYNGTQTGADLLSALSSDTTLQIGYDKGYGPTDGNPSGVFPNRFSFNGHSETGSNNNYWAYFTGNDGQNWTYSQVGASSSPLSNGSWDGWSWDVGNAYPAPAPVTPAAVPEASSVVSFALLLALGTGAAAFARKKTRA